ncbi:hypothetical protein Leryth_019308 [Lithospermum erythrorhizon]|nr:hypothetical protein Leryth_019308 [Lithospermum erythrorhizon]
MINKCGKLPLAISALGGILRNRASLKDWKRINNDIDSTLNQDLGNLGDSGTISKVLSLSYYDLPHFLKPCFLYMSVFREDQNIDPKKLYHLWIAEGLISKRYCLKGETLMDV